MVGRRGGGHQRGGGSGGGGSARENSTDLSSSSSKKKQKDRANQESREAKRAAASVDGVIAEVKKGELDSASLARRHVCCDSSQMCDRDEEWLLGINVAGQMERFLNPLDFYRTHPSAEEPVESVCVGVAKLKMSFVQPSVCQFGQSDFLARDNSV